MGATRLVLADMCKTYRRAFTLGPISLTVTEGVTCLVGPNGAGKSTLFRLAAGVDRPTSGSVRLETDDAGQGLGYLPQEPQLPGSATCEEFLHYVAWLQRIPRQRRSEAVELVLDQVGLSDRRSSRIRELSGGMRRRLGIGHALVHGPALVLLDEPTVGLDPKQRIGLRQTVGQVSQNRIVLVATHLVEDVRGLADRVIVLNEGAVVYDGDVPGLERLAEPDAAGDTDLERAIAGLMGDSE
ncbi:ABC transporter ATP-binding protein [Plantactinospora mayteni]|uniref:ABC transporter ATP-binding protein n=1 Tax=Plantactinospora mayteni TaxID=566021 RepID=A0ABQ4ETQ5_9ACTN|nr:ATP-binding cassette domain-containing protein [Plantactinospora mayteni]GIG97999.1 ABC transporter ATP-binding protein [Plantactinospora mayteni]